jgi:hypothetical protein
MRNGEEVHLRSTAAACCIWIVTVRSDTFRTTDATEREREWWERERERERVVGEREREREREVDR